MYAEPLSLLITQKMLLAEATSALPDAPVRDDRSRIGMAVQRNRVRIATSLRAVATRVDPYVTARVSRTA